MDIIYFMMTMLATTGLLQHSVSAQIADVRLTGGSNHSGTLQFLNSRTSSWQNYCGGIDIRTLSVICRMLGHDSDSQRILSSGLRYNYGGGYLRFSVYCNGDEAMIADCRVINYYRQSSCLLTQVTCPTCINGSVRLTDGLVPEQGNVEVCIDGSWSSVCSRSSWDYKDSFVVCRQLGYPATQAVHTAKILNSRIGFVPSSNIYHCIGNESSLLDCNHASYQSCQYDNSVGLYQQINIFCRGNLAETTQCSPGAIRLSGGRDQFEGRVEVCSSNGVWGTVSRTGWDSNDATVACRQLGLLQGSGILTRVTLQTFGPGVGPILLYNLRCTGSERRLVACPSSSNYYTSHGNDAGVRCQHNPSPVHTCTSGEVRLVGGNSSSEGRVEMCYRGVWGSICTSGWSNNDAFVVCRQLGLRGQNSMAITSLPYGEGSGPYLLSYVGCSGRERNLTECSYGNSQIGYHTCSSGQDAGVRCEVRCNHGDVRVYGGNSRADGLAQVCINGLWAKICYQNWNINNSNVFCRQLLGRESIAALYTPYCCGVTPSLTNVVCGNGISATIVHGCSYQYTNSSCTSILIGCYAIDDCVDGSIRLTDGSGSNNGVVEICLDGAWGTITSSSWGTSDAAVLCRQLGFPWDWSGYWSIRKTQSQLPHLLHGIYCNGNEDALLNCSYRRLSLSQSSGTSALSYRGYSAAAVTCQGNSSQLSDECTSGDVRLANSSNNNMEGRVEICTSGMWVSVCDHSWSKYETQIFCKQLLGYPIPAVGSFEINGGFYGTGNNPVVRQVYCNNDYNTPDINSCTINHQLFGSECHERQVGVLCQGSVFHVTVTSNTTGPVPLGSAVELYCSISPDPSIGRPIQLRYRWRGNYGGWSTSSFSPNVTLTVHVSHYETSYFCSVYISDYIVGVGSIIIKGRELLIPVLKVSPIELVEQNNLTLGVNVTSDSAEYIMRNLNWYFNGIIIGNSSNTFISNGNKTLTITDGTAGEYEVRYDGLLLNNPYDSTCEKMILKNLRHHPLFKPVKFFINTQEMMNRKPDINIQVNGAIESVITFTNGDNFTLKAVGQLATSIEPSEVDIVWYFNGNSVGSSSRVLNRNFISRDLIRTSSTYNYAGIYEALLIWNMNQECSSYYRQLSSNRVILARASIEVSYHVSLDHSFSADKNALFSSEVALLRCSATIRYPPLSSISIVKNDITLQTTSGTTLSVRTGRMGVSTFGLYWCRVNTTGAPIISLKVIIKEKTHLRIQFQMRGPLECSENTVFIQMVEASVTAKLGKDCSCNITANDLQMSSLQCNNAQTVTFSTLVVFSSDSGDETASTLTNRFSSQVSASAVSLNLDGTEVLVTSACSGDCSSNVGAYVGLFFGGALFCAVLIALLVVVAYLIYRRKSSKNADPPKVVNVTTEGEVRYSNRSGELQVKEKPAEVYKKKPKAPPAKTKPKVEQNEELYEPYELDDQQEVYECVD